MCDSLSHIESRAAKIAGSCAPKLVILSLYSPRTARRQRLICYSASVDVAHNGESVSVLAPLQDSALRRRRAVPSLLVDSQDGLAHKLELTLKHRT